MQTLEAIHRRVLNRTCRVHGSACGMRNRQGKVSRQSRLKYYREASTTSASSSPPSHVVVLGAGISGLTSAFYLQRRYPDTKITVLEEQKRIGGWIKTNTVDLGSEYGRVVLETGPRTLRAVSHELLELVNLLQLQSQLVLTPKSSPAATKRYLHLSKPDGNGLKALPSSPLNLFVSPFFFTLVSSVILERYWPANRNLPIKVPEDDKEAMSLQMKVYDDESVDSFLTRRFGEKVARLLGSALVHGVYAADSRVLSLRASFPSLWDAEDRGRGSVIGGILRAKKEVKDSLLDTGDMLKIMSDVSVFSFRNGISAIPDALERVLSASPSTNIRLSTKVNSIQPSGDGFLVRLQTGETVSASHLISALPLHILGGLVPPNQSLPHLNFNPSSTVQVINFVFACSRADLHPEGFGYLKPRPANGYDGPDRGILGTVFDSCALSDQDTAGSKPITKVTVMCGGPYSHSTSNLSVDRILDELFIHLGKKRMEPIHVEVHEQRDCIPTPLVGHLERMDHLRRILREEPWNGRLQVIGAGVNGAGIADCVQAARAGAFGV
ncbi:oxygen-dependent protoporphyrinogen oxidase [Serendipita sp. 407]|nr:oxygen-dependent protoporphyrinogen oxidase [Serendipita sp. 407]